MSKGLSKKIRSVCWAIVALMVLAGCAKNSDGSMTLGMKGSSVWHKFAPSADVAKYYDSMKTYELCLKWSDVYHKRNRDRYRKLIAESLDRRGEDPLKCFDPQSDRIKEVEKRARDAEARAAAAERRASEAEMQRYWNRNNPNY